ncbi:MAG: 50S ribosomal protein L11 methyltransferase [Actinomycetota bacterium]
MSDDWLVEVTLADEDDPIVAAIWETRPTAVEEGDGILVAGFADQRSAREAASWLGSRARLTRVADDSWADAWRPHAEAVVVGDVALVPTWCGVPDDVAISVLIEPGRSFGAGNHPSTRLAASWVRELTRPGDRVLDVGTGTGVLGVLAAQCGAGGVVGIDIEEEAIDVALGNARRNDVADRFVASTAPLDELPIDFDLVVANILPGTLRNLAPELVARMGADARLVLSGILAADADGLVADFDAVELDRRELDGWVSPLLGVTP